MPSGASRRRSCPPQRHWERRAVGRCGVGVDPVLRIRLWAGEGDVGDVETQGAVAAGIPATDGGVGSTRANARGPVPSAQAAPTRPGHAGSARSMPRSTAPTACPGWTPICSPPPSCGFGQSPQNPGQGAGGAGTLPPTPQAALPFLVWVGSLAAVPRNAAGLTCCSANWVRRSSASFSSFRVWTSRWAASRKPAAFAMAASVP